MVFYIAGADPYEHDKLGHLDVSKEGLLLRDQVVLRTARKCQAPIVIVMAEATRHTSLTSLTFTSTRSDLHSLRHPRLMESCRGETRVECSSIF